MSQIKYGEKSDLCGRKNLALNLELDGNLRHQISNSKLLLKSRDLNHHNANRDESLDIAGTSYKA